MTQDRTVKYVNGRLYELSWNCYSVSFKCFYRLPDRKNLMGWLWWVTWTRIGVIGVNFDQGKRNLVRFDGEFELSEFKWNQIQMKWDLVRISGGVWVNRVWVTRVPLYSSFYNNNKFQIFAVVASDQHVLRVIWTKTLLIQTNVTLSIFLNYVFYFKFHARVKLFADFSPPYHWNTL